MLKKNLSRAFTFLGWMLFCTMVVTHTTGNIKLWWIGPLVTIILFSPIAIKYWFSSDAAKRKNPDVHGEVEGVTA